MTTPDTKQTAQQREAELDQELVDALGDELDRQAGGHVSRTAINERAEALFNAIGAQLAAIRRQAAADALTEHARGLDKQGVFFSTMKLSASQKGDTRSAEIWALRADQSHGDANRLHRAAADKLAEGYEYECAAFSQECETRVPDAGDFCSKHEPEDDDDPRWAE